MKIDFIGQLCYLVCWLLVFGFSVGFTGRLLVDAIFRLPEAL